ncbi:T9SS type A sorting domain-containing protein [Flavobacterium sp. TSSA_36]|uniref:T9SS type A sorting domain-containing protein n=1 Tax=Flavobacterium sp. TSSA_36 TaxID=3447669 RepID=UPI003F339076
MTFYYTLKNSGQPSGILYVKFKYSSSTNATNLSQQNIQSTNWSGGIVQSTIACSLNSSEIQVTGSSIYLEFVSTSGVITTVTCTSPLTKTPPPSFSFTPTSLSLPCGDTNPRIFTVTPANIPSGATVTYQWSYSGWSEISSTSISKTLQPNSGTSLPTTVSVNPYINGVAQATKTCAVTRSTFTSIASITGNSNLCTSSNTYTISNTATNTITWSCSNTAIATLNVINPTTVTLTKIGSGTVNLIATLTNACGQITEVSKTVNVGSPILPATVFVNGPENTGYNQTLNYSLSGSSINGGTSYQWSVEAPINDDGGSTCAWQIVGGQGTQTVTLKSGCISATVVVRVVATSSCGASNTKYIYVTVGSDPCPPALRLSQNPIKDGSLIANVLYPPDCDPNARIVKTVNNEVKIYDFNGNIVHESNQNSNELIVNNLQLKKGVYFLQVITEKGEVIKDKIIIE